MKFGHNLLRNQVPEWASNYINYKGLKKLIKSAAQSLQDGTEPDLAEFFFSLDRNLEDVDAFYNKKYAESARRLKLLHGRYGSGTQVPEGIDRDEVEDLMGALLEIRGQLRKLQWYAELNRKGFVKITKKLGKKTGKTDIQQRYLVTKVDNKEFATNHALLRDLHSINDWLSALADAKIVDDASSVTSAASLRGVSARAILSLPSGLLDTVDGAIRTDDAAILEEVLLETNKSGSDSKPAYQKLLLNLLQRAISCKSRKCIQYLLQGIDILEEEDDIHKRNCLHRLVISISRTKSNELKGQQQEPPRLSVAAAQYIMPAESPANHAPPARNCGKDNTLILAKSDESVQLLQFVLNTLSARQRPALEARDAYGRIPLHYAALYGFVAIVEIVISHMQQWGQFDVTRGIDASEWQDLEGLAPLHLAVINQHPLATKCLLTAEKWKDGNLDVQTRKRAAKSGEVLALATKQNSVSIVQLLVGAGVDVNYQDDQGETALHIAARFGYKDCAIALLGTDSGQRAELDIPEKTFAWTPLFIACVDGHLPIVDLLVDAGADLDRVDSSGWTAKEHAALRGHIKIAQRLAEVTTTPSLLTMPSSTASVSGSPPNALSLEERRSHQLAAANVREPKPVKTFGHRYLTKDTMILVSLGSMDIRKSMNPVKLDAIPLADAHATQLDTALSVVVSASGATGEPTVIDLPVQENISTEPITFMTTDVTKVKLLFDIVPTYAGSNEKRVGRGAALLSSIRPELGSKRISLQGDLSVPIIAASTLDVIGSVHFNFLVITPFEHPRMSISEQNTYWKRMASTMVIGHRGLGKNVNTRKSLQLGENTIQSFIAAANLGASYVEFDVQLTKDHVPVIYHDFLVGETGIDAPVHTLTLEQFLAASEAQTPRPSRPGSPEHLQASTNAAPNGHGNHVATSRRPRAYSAGGASKDGRTIVPDMNDRMKHTRAIKEKGFKANVRGNFIQAPFTTLEEMFRKLPENIGFNIEMKYPRLDEAEEFDMDAYAVELNRFVDSVLSKVYDFGLNRNIIFSSFHPDICLLLSFKQPSIPVLFLTDAGTSPARDIRTGSLQEAIRFASRWNLLGVVSAAEPLCLCPRLVRVVKESGLVCVTYGTLNNDPKNVQLQVKQGIDAVIVDNVLAIRKGLTEPPAASKPPPAAPAPSNNAGADGASSALTETKAPVPLRATNENDIHAAGIANIVNSINGVPIYEHAAEGAVNGAVFSALG